MTEFDINIPPHELPNPLNEIPESHGQITETIKQDSVWKRSKRVSE